MSKPFHVDIEFQRGPSFCVNLDAADEATAKQAARQLAIGCGFTNRITKITVREAIA